MITGKKINKVLNLDACHAMYSKDDKWYHHLNKFPGILFGTNGYLIFKNHNDYIENPNLQHGIHLHVIDGISSVDGYTNYSEEEKKKLKSI